MRTGGAVGPAVVELFVIGDAEVGHSAGSIVGALVGDGMLAAAAVGGSVGPSVGGMVTCCRVGLGLGLAVVSTEGEELGTAGSAVGCPCGESVGAVLVGSFVGPIVGLCIGAKVASIDGDSVGLSAGLSIEEEVPFGAFVETRTGASVGELAGAFVKRTGLAVGPVVVGLFVGDAEP